MARIGGDAHARSARWFCRVVAILVGAHTAYSVSIPGTPSAAPGMAQPEPSATREPSAVPMPPPGTGDQPAGTRRCRRGDLHDTAGR
jgi:hypothetical protein